MTQISLDNLRLHVNELARCPRPYESIELEDARRYVGAQLREAGWNVTPHPFQMLNDRGDLRFGEALRGLNLIATPPEFNAAAPRLCVGAHLDSRPETPGADDNASGVAALLEMARVLPKSWPQQPQLAVEFLVFDLEENGMLGAVEHARLSRVMQVDLRGMISLEMLGYCDHRPLSQQLPRSLVGLYPDTGNFIAVIGNQNSTELINQFRTGAARQADLLLETLQVPENGNYLQATRLSDHSPFWDAGFAALMITDTSFMRNPHYHHSTDTPGTLDFDFLYRVTCGCLHAIRELLVNGLAITPGR